MPSEHLRKLWREAQARRRAKVANLAITGKRKAHKPRADHPWVVEKAVSASRSKAEFNHFETDYVDEPARITRENLYAELGW